MQPNHVLRPCRHCGNCVDIKRRCIGGQNGTGFCNSIELSENSALEIHIFEHRFDDQIATGQISDGQAALKAAHAGLDLCLRKPPFV